MPPHNRSERFTFDLDRIAPDWPDEDQRLAEWARLLGHYLPRLRDYFATRVSDRDILDEVVGHVLRRALLKLHEIGDAAATWNWMCRTGRNYVMDLARRQRAQARRQAAYSAHLHIMGEDVVPADLVHRLADRRTDGNEGSSNARLLDEDDDNRLGGRIPIDRATYEARLGELSPTDRRLLELIEVEGCSHAEAAKILGLSSAAASRKRHSRACYFVREGVRAP